MPVINGVDCDSTFSDVPFMDGMQQEQSVKAQFTDEVIVGGAITGMSYVYRDWFANEPEKLSGEILLPDRATFDALKVLAGYPVANGGTPYDLVTPQVSWAATLDELSAHDPWDSGPLRCHAVFTKVADEGTPATTTGGATASLVFGTSGLTAEFDVNASSSTDGVISSWSVEYGDAAVATFTGPWSAGGAAIPTQTHVYASPDSYVVNVSVKNGAGVESANASYLVTVA